MRYQTYFQRADPIFARLRLASPLAVAVLLGLPVAAQTAPRTVSGRVVNALNGSPIPRALVRLNARSVLTDGLGRFSFAAFTDQQGYAQVTKPGYGASSEAVDGPAQQVVQNLDAPVELQLYPDALVTGTVVLGDGEPLVRVQVMLVHETFTGTGLQTNPSGMTMTDSHGEFRFSVPAGHYRAVVRYAPRLVDSAESALPVSFPEGSSNRDAGFFSVEAGQERRVELRPPTGVAHNVLLRLPSVAPGMLRVSATSASGDSFTVPAQQTGTPGSYSLSLPSGPYALQVTLEDREAPLVGEAKLSVAGHDGSGTTVELAPSAFVPVELSTEAVAGSTVTTAVTSQQFNLYLKKSVAGYDEVSTDTRPRNRADHNVEFRLAPGRYHLVGSNSGAWSITSATYGTTNLFTDDLVIGPASAGSAIRLTASNAQGRVTGSVRLSGAPAPGGWIYLIPRTPALEQFYQVRLGSDGTFSVNVPPGSYTAIAVAHKLQVDLRDPETRARVLDGGRSVEVTDGSKPSVDLDLVTETAR